MKRPDKEAILQDEYTHSDDEIAEFLEAVRKRHLNVLNWSEIMCQPLDKKATYSEIRSALRKQPRYPIGSWEEFLMDFFTRIVPEKTDMVQEKLLHYFEMHLDHFERQKTLIEKQEEYIDHLESQMQEEIREGTEAQKDDTEDDFA